MRCDGGLYYLDRDRDGENALFRAKPGNGWCIERRLGEHGSEEGHRFIGWSYKYDCGCEYLRSK